MKFKFLKDKKETISLFKREELSWKETYLGGCTQIEPCMSEVTTSFIECITCTNAVHKKEKIENVILHLTNFISTLNKDSIELKLKIMT